MICLTGLIDDAKCYEVVRQFRWPNGVHGPHGHSESVTKRGHHTAYLERYRYHCHSCDRDFDDLTKSIFAGRHQPLRVWIVCLYLMGLNLSNQQIAKELNLNKDDVQKMTHELRQTVVDKAPAVTLSGEVEFDKVYVTAGHKGHPVAVKKRIVPVNMPEMTMGMVPTRFMSIRLRASGHSFAFGYGPIEGFLKSIFQCI